MALNTNPLNLARVFLTNHANRRALIANTYRICVRTPAGHWHVRTIEHAFHPEWTALTPRTGAEVPFCSQLAIK
jgi:hypothetical protein